MWTLQADMIPAPELVYPLVVWVVMAVVAVLNGGARELLLIPRVGERRGHVISTAILVLAILLLSGAFFTTTTIEYSNGELVLIGVGWTALTVGFEFIVGNLEGTPPEETIAQYDVRRGHVWIAVPLTLLFAPLAFGWLIAG